MAKHQKTLERMQRKPPPSDVRWDDLQALLKHLGYAAINNDGSRRKFYNKEMDALIICHKPHPNPEVDKGCIVDVVEHLKANGLIEESNDGNN